jgi:hypothetical protein
MTYFTVNPVGLVIQPRRGPKRKHSSLLMWMTWCHKFHCSGTVRLVPDRVATPLPAALLLLRDVTANMTCSSHACAIVVMLISCLLYRNLVTALYMLKYNETPCRQEAVSEQFSSFELYFIINYRDDSKLKSGTLLRFLLNNSGSRTKYKNRDCSN